jgi:hypothetical protein
MLRILAGTIMLIVLVSISGCDIDRMNRLEKQNEELRAELAKNRAAGNLD